MLLLLEKVSVSPAKKPPMLTVALTSASLSGSVAVAPESSPTGVLCDDAGLSELSVNVGLVGVIDSVGCWSSETSSGTSAPSAGKVGEVRNAVGAAVLASRPRQTPLY